MPGSTNNIHYIFLAFKLLYRSTNFTYAYIFLLNEYKSRFTISNEIDLYLNFIINRLPRIFIYYKSLLNVLTQVQVLLRTRQLA